MTIDEEIYVKSKELIEILVRKNEYISTAESCTGGMIASSIVSIPSASACFNEGFITYSNEAKHKYLGVENDTLNKYGPVSENTVKEMVKGVINISHSDIAVVSSGIAGPTGGTKEKPVGLVYLACAYKDNIFVKNEVYSGDRTEVRKKATLDALSICIDMLTK